MLDPSNIFFDDRFAAEDKALCCAPRRSGIRHRFSFYVAKILGRLWQIPPKHLPELPKPGPNSGSVKDQE
ncbi:hypothetical protein [Methylobacterium flocculans]|uniref:hypothetical protein n=1 Tax=Methylobacterium flocculans TaxID=2984843 RepID=UPI0021F28DA4|nr:hypothetical protein [Methylobacterium sp. FF17]